MANLSRVNFVAQQRIDLHHYLAMESFTAADFRAIISAFSGSSGTYIIRGLQVVSKNGLNVGVRVSDAMIMNPIDNNGSFYSGLSSDADVSIDLPADQTNIFVEGIFENTTQSPVNTGQWDPISSVGEDASGQEYTASVDFENILQLSISVNTTGFTEGAVPLFRATTSASAVTAFYDERNLLFRLGTGSDPLHKYNWSTARAESVPSGTGVADAVDSPWRSRDAVGSINDKAFGSFKDWADAVMTLFSEITGSSLWYKFLSGSGLSISLQQLFFDTIGHQLQASKNAAFKWSTIGGNLKLSSEGVIALNGTTSQYHNGLIRWQANNSGLEWELGGTFSNNVPGGKRNYLSSGLRFESPAVVDGGNIYLALEREVSKGSGSDVNWGDPGTSPFTASESVSGTTGDFTGIALGDYIRKESGGILEYFKVVGLWNGTVVTDNSVASEQNTIADSNIIALELQSVMQPDATSISMSVEPLKYWRSRYSSSDIVADTTVGANGVAYNYQSSSFYWLGRRNGSLFYLRDYGTMQEGEEVTTLDAVHAQGNHGSGNGSLVFEHAKEAVYNSISGYGLKTGSGTLVTIRRRKRDNTIDTPSSGDNSGALLTYTITAPVGAMTVGQNLWARLSDTTGGALSAGSVTNTTDDENNTDVTTNVYEIRDASDTPTDTFDNIDVFLIARRVDINGQTALIFTDGSILTEFGQMIQTNLDISGELRLNDYDDTAIPFIAQNESKLLDQDSGNFFYNKTSGTIGLRTFRITDNNIALSTPANVNILSNLGANTANIGTSDSTINILGDLIVQGDTFGTYAGQLQSDDKVITLGVGNLTSAGGGSGIEVADDTKTTTQVDTTVAIADVVLTYGAAHGYVTTDVIGVAATEDVGGITAGQISGEYTVVVTATAPGEAEVLSPTTLKIITSGTATSTATSSTNPPRTFKSPSSFRLGGPDGTYGLMTSWVFRVKGVATAPALTPVTDYGIVATSHSVNMVTNRVPFVNNDNQGPGGVDSTLNYSGNFTWNNSTNTLSVVGSISSTSLVPAVDDTYDIGENSTPLRWRILHLGPGSDSGIRMGSVNLYENGTDLMKTDDVFESAQYVVSENFYRLNADITSLGGPTSLPASGGLNIFQRGGFVYSQDSGGKQRLLTNDTGNVYNELVEIVSSPSGNNQYFPISVNDVVTIPQDSNFLLDSISSISTDGSTSTVTVTITGHGLLTGNLITTVAKADVGGITAANLSQIDTSVTVIDPDTFTFVAGAVSTFAENGYIDQIITTRVRYYVVGSGELEIYDNGVKQQLGLHYEEVGAAFSTSNQIRWLKNINADTPSQYLEYRIDANAGLFIVNQSAGGSSSLQVAYSIGNAITITPGTPFTVTNPGAGKAVVINGDLDVTGIIDPIGIQLTPVSSDPFPAEQTGLYVDLNGDLVHSLVNSSSIVNISQVGSGSAPNKVVEKYVNNTIGTLTKGTPVMTNSAGTLIPVDISQDNALRTSGVVYGDIASTVTGDVVTHGKIEDVTLDALVNDILYVSPSGGLIGSSEFSVGDSPAVGVNGFLQGHHIIRVGIVRKNLLDSNKKDIAVNIQIMGQL